jgi:uncharacterized protein (DUF2062 family)
MIRQYVAKYLISPLRALLKQGITPARLALSMASGLTIGLFPIVGTTTAICTMLAIGLRMNLLVIQLGNWLIYPLQLILVVPFLIMGEHIFGSTTNLDPSYVAELLRTDILLAVQTVSRMILHGAFAWALCAPLIFLSIYAVLLPLFRIMGSRTTMPPRS